MIDWDQAVVLDAIAKLALGCIGIAHAYVAFWRKSDIALRGHWSLRVGYRGPLRPDFPRGYPREKRDAMERID